MVLSSTLDFLLVLTLDGLPELGSSFKEIFLVAPFETRPDTRLPKSPVGGQGPY